MAARARAMAAGSRRTAPRARRARRSWSRRWRRSCSNLLRSEFQGRRGIMAEKRTQPIARDAMAYVLAGGRGSRLKELTDVRAKPAVYFGGKTRIIDFALSNALNS